MKTNLEWLLYAKTGKFKYNVSDAKRAIEKALDTGRNFYTSVSFGKDSSVMLRLILDIKPDIPVLYMNSGYALPDTNEYYAKIKEEWNLNMIELPAQVDYIELCQEFGLPHLRSSQTQKKVVQFLKKNRASNWAVENGYTGLFWGIRADESKGRNHLCKSNPNGILDKNDILRIAPLAKWKARDVWAYIFSTNMPYNKLYDHENCGYTRETIRNTGWLSTDGETNGYIEWIKKNYPEQYVKLRELL